MNLCQLVLDTLLIQGVASLAILDQGRSTPPPFMTHFFIFL